VGLLHDGTGTQHESRHGLLLFLPRYIHQRPILRLQLNYVLEGQNRLGRSGCRENEKRKCEEKKQRACVRRSAIVANPFIRASLDESLAYSSGVVKKIDFIRVFKKRSIINLYLYLK